VTAITARLAPASTGAVGPGVYERYQNSEAVIEHATHVGDLMEAIFATGSVSSELLGEPSAELTAATAGSGVSIFRPFLSM
jgi:hypothetical protein